MEKEKTLSEMLQEGFDEEQLEEEDGTTEETDRTTD